MARRLTISLQAVSGTIERFYAFVGCTKRIVADGTDKPSWTGDVADDPVKIRVRVFGIGTAKYKLEVDLPGVANDQKLELSLDQGYGELELSI